MVDDTASGRPTQIAVTAGLLLVLGAAVAFARADQTGRVVEDMADIRRTERMLGDVSVFRADLAIAVVAAVTDAEAAVAMQAFEAAREVLGRMTATATAIGDPDVIADLSALEGEMASVAESIAGGDPEAADEAASTAILPLLDDISRRLEARSAGLAARIEAEGSSAGRLARLSSYTVALLVPALALWAYRRTIRRRIERERLHAELIRERELNKAKDELIAGLSHELRTPLTAIQGFADALLDLGAGDSLDRRLVDESAHIILDETNRLGRMVDDILVAARHDAASLSFEPSPVPVEAPVAAAVEPFRRAGHLVDTDLEAAIVEADPLRLRHVVGNLVSNAVRHGAPPVSVRGRRDGDGYVLSVEDAGRGIDPGREGKLFTPFVHSGREATVTGSLGLGLHVVKVLAEGMSARTAHRRVEGKTVFEVTLPLVEHAGVLEVAGRPNQGDA